MRNASPAEEGKTLSAVIQDALRAARRQWLRVVPAKFSRDRDELSRVAVLLAEMGETVEPTTRLDVFRDEPDNRILECAMEGRVEAIVTGDKAMLAIGEYEGKLLITLADYLKRPGSRR